MDRIEALSDYIPTNECCLQPRVILKLVRDHLTVISLLHFPPPLSLSINVLFYRFNVIAVYALINVDIMR